MRQFKTGATRDSDATKPDYEGFLSPAVMVRYAEYMNQHRIQADGKVRESDNWQKGIPKNTYIKSHLRHTLDWWLAHRGLEGREPIEDALCAVIFNASGYLFELLRERRAYGKNGSCAQAGRKAPKDSLGNSDAPVVGFAGCARE